MIMSNYRNYYDSSYGRARNDSTSKSNYSEARIPLRIPTRYGATYNCNLPSTSSRESNSNCRIKTILDKDSSHPPPVSYKSRSSGAHSRDPSPSTDKSERIATTSSSSSSYINPNRLYPRSYTRANTSRESTVSPAGSTSNLPRLTSTSTSNSSGTSSKYTSRSSNLSKDDTTSKYSHRSKDDSISSKYKSSREDLTGDTKKYLTSRFLPKNSVERSYTAYSRPSTIRTNEVSRKNKELLTVLHVQQEQDKLSNSRSISRSSSMAADDSSINSSQKSSLSSSLKEIEMETVKVCTRGTSPKLGSSTQPSFLRSRRIELAKTIEKTITRPKTVKENMVDKEIQSDRLDDSTKSSRFAGASRINATPWSSFLDMKFSSPITKKNEKSTTSSPKSLSRTSSTKSVNSEKERDSKKSSNTNLKSKLIQPKQSTEKKLLPPPIPKTDASNKNGNNGLHSLNTPNKDFRKSVLNMNPDGSRKRLGRRSNSASSAESDNADPDATDISENLSSCKSYHQSYSGVSKLPQKLSSSSSSSSSEHKQQRDRRSPSSDVSTTGHSSNEEEKKCKNMKSKNSSRTSMAVSTTEEFSPETRQPRQKNDADAKNFLMRALAPVTNLFKGNRQSQGSLEPSSSDNQQQSDLPAEQHEKVIWILDPSSDSLLTSEQNRSDSSPKNAKLIIHRMECASNESPSTESTTISHLQPASEPIDMKYGEYNNPSVSQQRIASVRLNSSGEAPWWLDASQPPPEGVNTYDRQEPQHIIKHVESGEPAWWLDGKSTPPEGVETYPNWVPDDKQPEDDKSWCTNENQGMVKYVNNSTSQRVSPPQSTKPLIRHIQSGEKAWWLEEDCTNVPEGVKIYKENNSSYRNDPDESAQYGTKAANIKIRHIDSGEEPWWVNDNVTPPEDVERYPNSQSKSSIDVTDFCPNDSKTFGGPEFFEKHKIRHIDSGERAWWLTDDDPTNNSEVADSQDTRKYEIEHQNSSEKQQQTWWMNKNDVDDEQEFGSQFNLPLGDRASPEGLEMSKEDNEDQLSSYDNLSSSRNDSNRRGKQQIFISKHRNIDEILGGGMGQLWSPLISDLFEYDDDGDCFKEINAKEVIIHEAQSGGGRGGSNSNMTYNKLDDAALQLYKDGDYGSYLDLDASISEQQEEFEGFELNKKNSIVLRTQLSVRVHTIIEKLLTSEGRELRRALFSLKQIFQEDKDLVHEFVQNDGLSCLIKVGSEADQNYQNYILRALGQVMLYVDGMNGVIEHNQTIQWLYSLISSKFRLVVKTALKLLLVFVEYTESNCMLLVEAIRTIDYSQGLLPYYNIMKLLKDFDTADEELLIYATTLVNKILNAVPDQDIYYDQIDALEEQGMESIIQRYMSKQGTDLDLLQQFRIYETVLQYEDGEEKHNCSVAIRHLDESIKKTLRLRKSLSETTSTERRKSRRHSTGTTGTPFYGGITYRNNNNNHVVLEDYDESSSSNSGVNNTQLNGSYKENNKANEAGVTPALKRRRERAERQRSFMREQQETVALLKGVIQNNNNCNNNNNNNNNNNEESIENINGHYNNALYNQRLSNGNNNNNNNILNKMSNRKDLTPYLNAVNKLDTEENSKPPWIMSMKQNQDNLEDLDLTNENDRNIILQLKKENTVKDLTQRLANQSIVQSPTDDMKINNRFGDMSGLISKAKEGLAKSKSKVDILKTSTTGGDNQMKIEPKKSENELRWEELVANLKRPLNLCDMDFTDLVTDDETDILAPAVPVNGIPPPPPPLQNMESAAPPPPPLSNRIHNVPPPVPNTPMFGISLLRPGSNKTIGDSKISMKKNKKTVKLFWKEVRDDPISHSKLKNGYIWDELNPVIVDTQKLEHLFESRAKDIISKKQQELNKNKEIIVLDPKRSNAINIGMTKLPPPRSIKTAILKMDATIMNREGIEKLMTMLPTEEERTKIQEAQAANPDLPLGSAEQFLLTLASISELPARLKLWAFKLDFENSEREIAEPLMDLKQGFEVLKINKTFRAILSTLLSIGNFLNGNEVKGFQIEYLTKVPEVKDTVHKHSLLHHLCYIVMEKFPEATDLYSEIGAITRASKVDFDELTLNIQRLEADCKASWDHLKLIAKHDGSTMMKVRMSEFLGDCAERIILLSIVHRRIMNRYHKFLLWLGIPFHQVADTKPNEFSRIISEFALEYRTTRERVLQQLEKKANHRERNKTRGKMITEMGKFRSKEDRADAELRQLLGSDISDVESMQGTLPWRHRRRDSVQNRTFTSSPAGANGNLTDGDDEILESLVKTATKGPRTAPRERKRTRYADRKSLRRTLKNGLSEEDKKHLSTYIKGY